MSVYRTLAFSLRVRPSFRHTQLLMTQAKELFDGEIAKGSFPTLRVAPFQGDFFRVMESGKPWSIRSSANSIPPTSSQNSGNRFSGPLWYSETESIAVPSSLPRKGGLYTGSGKAVNTEMFFYKVDQIAEEDEARRIMKKAGLELQAMQEWDGSSVNGRTLQQIQHLEKRPSPIVQLLESGYKNPLAALVNHNFFKMQNERPLLLFDLTGSSQSQLFCKSLEQSSKWLEICKLLGQGNLPILEAMLDPDFAPVAKAIGQSVADSTLDGLRVHSARANPKLGLMGSNTFFPGKDSELLNFLTVVQEGVILPGSGPKPTVALFDVTSGSPLLRPDERV